MFQNFSIFGISEENMKNFLSDSYYEELDPELLYSYNDPTDIEHQASRLVFPSGAAIKRLSN